MTEKHQALARQSSLGRVPDEPITANTLRNLFEVRHIITEGSKFEDGAMMKAPSLQAIIDLAYRCDGIRLHAKAISSMAVEINKFTETLRAIALLDECLPSLIEEISTAPTDAAKLGASPTTVGAIEAERGAWERLLQAVAEARRVLSSRYHFDVAPNPLLHEDSEPVWHELVDFMTEAFKDAMRSTNPGQELRFSNTGPVSRFLEAVIPLITGESVKGGSAIQHLRRKSQEG